MQEPEEDSKRFSFNTGKRKPVLNLVYEDQNENLCYEDYITFNSTEI